MASRKNDSHDETIPFLVEVQTKGGSHTAWKKIPVGTMTESLLTPA